MGADLRGRAPSARSGSSSGPVHANVRGAAFLAGIALGELTAEDVTARVPVTEAYVPDARRAALYDGLFAEFVKIYKATKPIYGRLNRGTRSSS